MFDGTRGIKSSFNKLFFSKPSLRSRMFCPTAHKRCCRITPSSPTLELSMPPSSLEHCPVAQTTSGFLRSCSFLTVSTLGKRD